MHTPAHKLWDAIAQPGHPAQVLACIAILIHFARCYPHAYGHHKRAVTAILHSLELREQAKPPRNPEP